MKEITINSIKTNVYIEMPSQSLTNIQNINSFEKELKFKLPEDYKLFLLEYNGGTCDLKNHIYSMEGNICDLYGLFPKGLYNSHQQLTLPKELKDLWCEIPDNILPIGELDNGDMIAIKFLENRNKIVVIDHEDYSYSETISVSTFTQFLLESIREN